MLFVKIMTAVLLGIVSGQVVNYLADVLPAARRLIHPACFHCHASQRWLDYLLLRRCTYCQFPKKLRYWAVLTAYLVISLSLTFLPPVRMGQVLSLLLLVLFGVIAVIDLEFRVVLDQISLVSAVFTFGMGIWLHGVAPTLLGALAGFGIMLILYYTGIWYTRWISRRRGVEDIDTALGFGDVNLGGVLGLLLGWPGIIAGLLFAIILGGVFSLIYIVVLGIRRKWRPSLAIPYAPFLLLGAILLLFRR
jgi:leader peptidase (prepilin peptidase)/N-methyltransferase